MGTSITLRRPSAITLLRTALELRQWSVDRSDVGVGMPITEDALEFARSAGPVEHEAPLAELAVGASRLADREIVAAFNRLAQVSTIDACLASDVLLVLERTVADPRAEAPALPALEIEPPPALHQPTAANPRAYRGTKDRPPKPRRPDPLDLRPFLLSRSGVERLSLKLREVAPDFAAPFEDWEAPASLRIACGGEAGWKEWSESDRRRLGELWRQLDGDSIPRLRVQLAVHATDPETTAEAVHEFLLSTLSAPPELRDAVALGLTTDLDRWRLVVGHSVDVAELCGLGFGGSPEARRHAAVWTRVLVRYEPDESKRIIDGARLSLLLGQDPGWGDGRVPHNEDNDLISSLMEDMGARVHWAGMKLWHRAAMSWDVTRILRMIRKEVDRAALKKETLEDLLEFTASVGGEDNADYLEDQVERALPAVLRAVEAAGADREEEALAVLKAIAWQRPSQLRRAASAIERWCCQPFAIFSDRAEIIEVLASASEEGWGRVLQVGDDAMLGFDAECSGFNDAFSTSVALREAIRVDEPWAIAQFVERPRPFMRFLRVLGLMKPVAIRIHLAQCRAEFGEDDVSELELKDIVARLEGLPLPSGAQLISKRVRMALVGDAALTQGQVERVRQKLIASWPDCVLQATRQRTLETMVEDFLPEGTTADAELLESLPGDMTHAIQFQAGVQENRRSLRRLLRAVFHGDDEYLAQHPRNVRWNKELLEWVSSDAASTWAQRPASSRRLPGIGLVKIAAEARPLEALRMGTYVMSCFGLGRSFSYAAAAVVLDANKQVLFARAETGEFLARQIVAISENWTLCCYAIYPTQEDTPLAEFFRDYNLELSRVLGIPIADEDDEVQTLIARSAWDDGIWIPHDGGPARE